MTTDTAPAVDEQPVVDRRSAIQLLTRRPDLRDIAWAGAVIAMSDLGFA